MAPNNDDALYLRNISQGLLEEFRNTIFNTMYITSNPAKFLNTDWVNVKDLKAFVASQKTVRPSTTLTRDNTATDAPINVKREASPYPIKLEPATVRLDLGAHDASKLRTRTIHENGKETIEILTDSESEPDSDIEVIEKLDDPGESSDTLVADLDFDLDSEDESDIIDGRGIDSIHDRQPSDTVWLDPGLTSTVSYQPNYKLNRQLVVDRLEFLDRIPTYWPVPRVPTAYIVDLRDSKFDIYNEKGKLIPVDVLIRNKDQDSYIGGSGEGDSKPELDIFTGQKEKARRVRLHCAGVHACEHVNPDLLDVERYELDPQSLKKVVDAQVQSRIDEADTPEKQAAIFFSVVSATSCSDDCNGRPIMKSRKKSVPGEPTRYFITCENWTPTSRKHRTSSIPDSIDIQILSRLFAGKPIKGFNSETPLVCGRIVPAHVGGKLKKCRFPHSTNGELSNMKKIRCSAGKTLFVPVNPKIRICVVVPTFKPKPNFKPPLPHTHPILPATKASYDTKNLYRELINAAGVVGSSVRTVDNARTTKLILKGKSPALIAPALQNTRLKRDILQSEKKKQFKFGEGIAGVSEILQGDLVKPLAERYVHSITTTPTGGLVVFTFQPYLLSLIHSAYTIQVDTTFKRTAGEMKEWEVVIWCQEVHRAVSVGRIYSNRADRAQYKKIFEELQRLILDITGKPLRLKRLSRNGTLLSIGVDMELAQVLGAGDAFLPTNEPEYSGITTEDPAILVTYFIRLCYTHAKCGVLELKPHVSQDDYNRLINFVYLESEEQIQEFSTWIQGLEIPKVKAWWKHKTDNSWILSSLIKCRSNMNAEDWALTQASTNIGEGQHHFTNINTGVHLSLVEAIITARELDEKTALEIQDNLSSGVLKNNRNDAYTRLFRGVTRANTVKRKQEEARERDSAGRKRRLEIDVLRQAQKENRERIKELSMQDKEEGGSRKRQKSSASKAESSSSGCAQVSSQSAQRSGVSHTWADDALTVNAITDTVLDAPIDYSIFAQDPPLVYMDNSFNEFDDIALAARWGAENLPALLDISNSTNVSAWSGEEQQVMQGMGSSSTDMHLNLNQQGMESMWTTPLNATHLDDAVFDKFLERFGDY